MEEGYCVHCKTKRNMTHPKRVILMNGRHMMKGSCEKCTKPMTKFVKKEVGS